MPKRSWLAVLAGLPLVLSGLLPVHGASAASPVQVILDGRPLTLNPAPTIVDDRTMVPLRGLLEAMGATVTWDDATRSVTATRGDKYIRLRIDRRLACLNSGCTQAATLDVPARLLSDRTFIPARFVSQAMGARVSWDEATRAVVIETDKAPNYTFTSITIPTLTAGQTITGTTQLRAEGAEGAHVQFYLIDPATGAGPMISAGNDVKASYTFWPDPTVKGPRLIVAGIRDAAGSFRYSAPVPVTMAPAPSVAVTGVAPDGTITDTIALGSEVNFVSTHSIIRLMDSMGNTTDVGRIGPYDTVKWYPQIGHNGSQWLQAVAYDVQGNAYESKPMRVNVQSGYRTNVAGLSDGATLKGPVTLRTTANFPIEYVKYIQDDVVMGWGFNYNWNLTEANNGRYNLKVEIGAKDGTVHVAGPYNITVNITPYVTLTGVGPNQVVTGAVTLNAVSNQSLASAEFYLTDSQGRSELLGRGTSLAWKPTTAGDRTLHVVAKDAAGRTLTSEKVSFRVFLGTVYGPKAVATKTEFLEMAKRLSVPAYRSTGMSASLQVAQALLETGWGQSVPVDKYTGQLSYNLFGIKGKGTAGGIISNTWEVYNGISYRVDQEFRAYRNVEESWLDHKAFLMERPWYAPFRAVITEPVLGAHGLRKSGYATDPEYPNKLIKLMKDNDLFKLNLIEP